MPREGGAADTNRSSRGGVFAGCPAEATDGFTVVLILIQGHAVVGGLDAHDDDQSLGRVPFVFRERLKRLRNKMLVEIGERRIDPPKYSIGGILVAIGIGPVVPHTRAENAPF